MPVHTGKDSKGCFAQYGNQKKYHYPCGNTSAMNKAKQKAHIQGAAIKKTGFKEQFKPPESGDAPKAVKRILRSAYDSCRSAWTKEHPKDKENTANKTSCSRIAWNAVKLAGWSKNSNDKWIKRKSESFATLGDAIMQSVFKSEAVSDRPWSQVNKSELPRSAFLVKGDPDKKNTWKLPYKDKQGNINLGALRAISQAIKGARTGKAMSVPADVRKKIDNLLKRYKIGKYAKKGKTENIVEMVLSNYNRKLLTKK